MTVSFDGITESLIEIGDLKILAGSENQRFSVIAT